jgi:hypothetical protein
MPAEADVVRRLQQMNGRLGYSLLAAFYIVLALLIYHGRLDAPLLGDARLLSYHNEFNRTTAGLLQFWNNDYFAGAITPGYDFQTGYYRPIANTVFWILHRVAGARALIYTLSEVLLHGLVAFLVFLLCLRIRRDRLAAGVAGLLFVLHPVHAFAATEPAALADVLSTGLYVLGVLAFDSALGGGRRIAVAAKLGLTVAIYLLAVLSKEMAITLPAVLALLVVVRHFERGMPLRRLAWTAPLWVAMAAYLAWRFGVLELGSPATGYAELYSPFTLALGVLKGGAIHLSRIVLPLGAGYPELNPWLVNFVSSSLADPLVWVALAILACLVALVAVPRRSPTLAFWSGFFLLTYSPLLLADKTAGSLGMNILMTDERWIYLPSIAVFAVAGLGVARLLRVRSGDAARAAVATAVVAICVLLGHAAAVHAGRAEDPFARLRWLYQLPEERLSRMQQADKRVLYARWVALPTGDLEEAEARAAEAVDLAPDSPIPAVALAEVLARRGAWARVIPTLAPWADPDPAALELAAADNPDVLFDLSRMAPAIFALLARSYAWLGDGELALLALCESVRRGQDDAVVAEILQEVWAVSGPAACAAAADPAACIAGATLPEGPLWRPPFEGATCGSWADRHPGGD